MLVSQNYTNKIILLMKTNHYYGKEKIHIATRRLSCFIEK